MPDTTRLHLAYRRKLTRIAQATTALALRADPTDIQPWLEAVVPTVLNGQRAAVRATDAYLSLEAGLATRSSTRPWGVDPERIIGAKARRGTPLEDVYGRNLRVNVGTLAGRVAREVGTDITLAQRSTAWIHTNGDPRIVGYRRVLGAGPNCALCAAASTRRYNSETLQPIHDHCGCSVSPIYSESGVKSRDIVVDDARLEALYEQVGHVTAGRELRRILVDTDRLPSSFDPSKLRPVRVAETPELGPTLLPV